MTTPKNPCSRYAQHDTKCRLDPSNIERSCGGELLRGRSPSNNYPPKLLEILRDLTELRLLA